MRHPIPNLSFLATAAAALGVIAAGLALAHGPKHNPIRHQFMMQNGLPAPYAEARNPLQPTAANLAAGKAQFIEQCASCHGRTGMGDGAAGRDLKPPPPTLNGIAQMPMAQDGYLLWSIVEGGEKLETAMPAFKDVLSRKQQWQVILYLRHGLSAGGANGGGRMPGMGGMRGGMHGGHGMTGKPPHR
ncbi:MAG: cytochrome c [Alphaproteobacteria bacterium]|nr:cytochrome c [Alphaproteobacteria bacterium]